MFLGDRLRTRILSDADGFQLTSSDSNSIPSISNGDEEKYIHLPSRNDEWKRVSLRWKSKADYLKVNECNQHAYINLVGWFENDMSKRVMVTVQPHETLNHLSSRIGQLMQNYRMFRNLLGLRATELKVVARNGHPIRDDDDSYSIRKLIRLNFTHPDIEAQQNESDHNEVDEPVEKVLQDGDEFVFKLISFDKWIKIELHFELEEEDLSITFHAKTEMRVAGYFQNSHFFQLLTKLAINIWNENIEEVTLQNDFYVIKDITFGYKEVEETINQDKKESSNVEIDSPNKNRFMNVISDIKKDIKSINIAKKNWVAIRPSSLVDEVFTHNSTVIVYAIFTSVTSALRDQKKNNKDDCLQNFSSLVKPGKYKNVRVGSVILQQINPEFSENVKERKEPETFYSEILPKNSIKDTINSFKFKGKNKVLYKKPSINTDSVKPKKANIDLRNYGSSWVSNRDR